VALDESFFFYDSLVRKVWIEEGKRPVAIVTGSHMHSCVFGALSLDGRQLFRQYGIFNEDTFKDFLKLVYYKFKRFYLFLDKAGQHYRSEKVHAYFDSHKGSLIPIWLPTASPEFMPLEGCWNISKDALLVKSCYPSFTEFKGSVGGYLRTKRFNLDIRKHLLGEAG